MREHANPILRSAPAASTLYDVLDLVLDKGLVVDIYARLSIVGLDFVTIDARVAVASVDTYLRFAAAVGRIDLEQEHPGIAGVAGSLGGHILGKAAGKVIDKVRDQTVEVGSDILGKVVEVTEKAVDKTVDRAADALRGKRE